MLSLVDINEYAPLTGTVVGQHPNSSRVISFLSQLMEIVNDNNEWMRILQQCDVILLATATSKPLRAVTTDDDMVLINIFSNILDNCITYQDDNSIEFRVNGSLLRVNYNDHDSDGDQCASIQVNH